MISNQIDLLLIYLDAISTHLSNRTCTRFAPLNYKRVTHLARLAAEGCLESSCIASLRLMTDADCSLNLLPTNDWACDCVWKFLL